MELLTCWSKKESVKRWKYIDSSIRDCVSAILVLILYASTNTTGKSGLLVGE